MQLRTKLLNLFKLSELTFLIVLIFLISCNNSKEIIIRERDNLSILEKKKKSVLNIIESSFKNRFQNISTIKAKKYLLANNAMLNEVILDDTLFLLISVKPLGGFVISETVISPKLSKELGFMLTNNFNLLDADFKITKINDRNLVNHQKKLLNDYFTLTPNKYYLELSNEKYVQESESGVFINCLIIYKTESKNGHSYYSYSNFILN